MHEILFKYSNPNLEMLEEICAYTLSEFITNNFAVYKMFCNQLVPIERYMLWSISIYDHKLTGTGLFI